MMRATSCAALLALALLPCTAGAQASRATPPAVTVRAENPMQSARADETIAIAWLTLRQRLPALAPGRARVRDAVSGTEVASQLLDANADGMPDSLLFQATFAPGETRAFLVEAAAAAPGKPRVHVKFVPERTDVAWESDRMAWRTYGQLLWQLENLHTSGVDVWVKRTRELVLDKWYAGGHDFYHLDRGEGADFFKVGSTLGGGATAVWRDGKMHRAENFRTHRIIADGPIRAVFELDFDPWDAAGLRVTETRRISIDAGHDLYRQESVFRTQGSDTLTYALGFVKRPGLVGSTSRAGQWAWLAGWGPVENKYGEGGHGDLGTAVMADRARVTDVKETGDHYLLLATARSGEPVVHWIGAGWTGSRDYRSVEDWWSRLSDWSRRLENPVRVTFGDASAAAAR